MSLEKEDVLNAFERCSKRHKDMWMRLTPIGLHLLYSTPSTSRHLTRIIFWEELKRNELGVEGVINLYMDEMVKELSK